MIFRGLTDLWSFPIYDFYFACFWACLVTAFALDFPLILLINILNFVLIIVIFILERVLIQRSTTLRHFQKFLRLHRAQTELNTRLLSNLFLILFSAKILKVINHWYYISIPLLVVLGCVMCIFSIGLVVLLVHKVYLMVAAILCYSVVIILVAIMLVFAPFFENDLSFRPVMIICSSLLTVILALLMFPQNYMQFKNRNRAWRRD